jgi:ubiquinone/menaquinone biosynthesis C-methylase UbiE
MNAPATIDYFMEDPREADRLEQKVNPEAWVKKYLDRYLHPDLEVLCVGCGPGNILRAISATQPTIHATGIDISQKRVEQARARSAAYPMLKFYCGNATEMQFSRRTFDVVYTRMLLQYLSQKEKAVVEMVRVAKPGATVLLQDLDGQLIWHYPEDTVMQKAVAQVTGALAESGFDPLVGRKLFWLAQKAGLEHVEVQVEPYHLVAGEIDPTAAQQWKLKLEIARPSMVRALGSEKEADEQIRRFMDYLSRPDTLTYSNLFTITGKKPL